MSRPRIVATGRRVLTTPGVLWVRDAHGHWDPAPIGSRDRISSLSDHELARYGVAATEIPA